MQLEQEVDELQIAYNELQEKYESIVASLESRLSVEKERLALLSAAQDVTARDLARERENSATQAEFTKFIKAENLCLNKTVEELQTQLRTSHQAVQILNQRSQIDITNNERQLQIVRSLIYFFFFFSSSS
jgi:hypothetical protein